MTAEGGEGRVGGATVLECGERQSASGLTLKKKQLFFYLYKRFIQRQCRTLQPLSRLLLPFECLAGMRLQIPAHYLLIVAGDVCLLRRLTRENCACLSV